MYIWHVYSSLHVSTPFVHIYIYTCMHKKYIHHIFIYTYTCIWWIFDSNVRCRSIYTYITSNRYVIYVYTYMRMLYIWPWSWWWSMNIIQTWGKFQCFKWHQSFDKNENNPKLRFGTVNSSAIFRANCAVAMKRGSRGSLAEGEPQMVDQCFGWAPCQHNERCWNMHVLKGMAKWSMALFKAFQVQKLQAAFYPLQCHIGHYLESWN